MKNRHRLATAGRSLCLAFTVLVVAAAASGCSERSEVVEDDGYVELGDLPALHARGAVRVLSPRVSEATGLPRQGHLARLEREFAEAFVQSQGLEPVWVWVEEWEDLIPALLEGRGDIVAALVTATPSREKLVAFSAPLTFVRERVVSRDEPPYIDSIADLVGRDVIVRRSSSYWETLESLKAEVPGVRMLAAPESLDTEEILYRVSAGEYDVTIADDILIKDVLAYMPNLRLGLALTDDRRIAWALRPDSPLLRAAADSFIHEFNPASDRADRYVGDLPAIKDRKVLRVLTRNNSSTYFVLHGQVMGFEYDLAREFAKQHGVHAEFIVVPTRGGLLAWLRQGRGDVVAAGLTPTEERSRRGQSFSRPYDYVSEVLVSRMDDSTLHAPADLAGRTIVVRRSSSYWGTVEGLRSQGIDVALVAAPEELETEEIIDAVARGEYDLTISDSNLLNIEMTWRDDVRGAFFVRDSVAHAWAVREGDVELKAAIDSFFNDIYRGLFYNVTRRKYFSGPKRVRSHATARAATSGTLSPYDDLFRRYAIQYDFDWRLVTAQSYQESRFDPSVISFAGAVGLMQVLPRTGRQFGFDNLQDPDEGVHAGVNYLRHLYDRLEDVPNSEDRLRFALAAYNAGYGHLSDARRLTAELGKDPDIWFGGVADVMPLLSKRDYFSRTRYGYCRCLEPVHYVRRIGDQYGAYAVAVQGGSR
ncbi:MAG: transporter substrate-binding domain-containing protein [Gemmatimonadales bacterium]